MNDTAEGVTRGIAAAGRAEMPAAGAGDIRFGPFKLLIPYVKRYRVRAIAASVALVVAALATLAVPIALRRMIDFGFTERGVELIDSYFTRDDHRCRGARACERDALLSRHHARRAHRHGPA